MLNHGWFFTGITAAPETPCAYVQAEFGRMRSFVVLVQPLPDLSATCYQVDQSQQLWSAPPLYLLTLPRTQEARQSRDRLTAPHVKCNKSFQTSLLNPVKTTTTKKISVVRIICRKLNHRLLVGVTRLSPSVVLNLNSSPSHFWLWWFRSWSLCKMFFCSLWWKFPPGTWTSSCTCTASARRERGNGRTSPFKLFQLYVCTRSKGANGHESAKRIDLNYEKTAKRNRKHLNNCLIKLQSRW